MNKFVDAIRYEIARSAEKAYESLRIQDLQKLLMIVNVNELEQFILQNNNKVRRRYVINLIIGRNCLGTKRRQSAFQKIAIGDEGDSSK